MPVSKSEILHGTLDLMVLKTLEAMGPLHGYGIARRIEQLSEEALQLNQGTIYAALVRLLQSGWISAAWGVPRSPGDARDDGNAVIGSCSAPSASGSVLEATRPRVASRGRRFRPFDRRKGRCSAQP